MSKCPYCGKNLEKKPTRKKKCPHCQQQIYVRNKKPVTEMHAEFLDFSIRNDYLGITFKQLIDEYLELSKRFGKNASARDTFWSILNKSLANADPEDWNRIYRELARITQEEGKDPKPFIRQALEAQLKSFQIEETENPVNKYYVEIDSFELNGCEKCQQLNGTRYSLEEAINTMPIPDLCEDPNGCRCRYRHCIQSIDGFEF